MVTTSVWKRALLTILAGSATALVAADEPRKPSAPPTPLEAHQKEAAEVAQALRESWPDHPEWVDMLTGILEEEPMGPSFGWFRTATTQTRFDWDATRKRYDRNHDGRIARPEFSGNDADFARIDRNHDSSLTPLDFDFSGSSLAPSPGALLFSRRPRRQRQGHARGAGGLLPGDR